jgi:uncharacterized SAM-binding protein YcdF (DUF218 family)
MSSDRRSRSTLDALLISYAEGDRLFVDDASQLLLPVTPYLVLLLLVLTVWAFRHRVTRLGRWRYGVLVLCLWSGCMSTPRLGNALLGSLEAAYPPVTAVPPPSTAADKPLIVVLTTGSIFKDGGRYRVELGDSGWERLHHAVTLWRQVGGVLLFTGGPSGDGTASVAAHMAALARSWGVPDAAVKVETKSRSTYENLTFTRDVIAAHTQLGDAWLVTIALHMRRAMGVAQKLGLRVRPYPCDHKWRPMRYWYSWLPNAGGPDLFAQAFYEIVGRTVYRLRGYAVF